MNTAILDNINEQRLSQILLNCNIRDKVAFNQLFINNTLIISNNNELIFFFVKNNTNYVKYINISSYAQDNLPLIDSFKYQLFQKLVELANLDKDDDYEYDNIVNIIQLCININYIIIDPTSINYKLINDSVYDINHKQIVMITSLSEIDLTYDYSTYAFSMTSHKDTPILLDQNNYHYYFYNNGIITVNILSNYNINKIQDFSFGNCLNLTNFNCECSTLTEIGKCAFTDTAITNLDIQNSISCINDYAFEQIQINELNIPSNIKCINKCAFINNYKLSTINIFSNNIYIENDAFHGAQSLLSVFFEEYIDNNLSLSPYIFNNCENLQYIVFKHGISFKVFEQTMSDKIPQYKIVIPEKNYNDILGLTTTDNQREHLSTNFIKLSS